MREALSIAAGASDGMPLVAVSIGTPHASLRELRRVGELLDGRRVAAGVECIVSTGRETLAAAEEEGLAAPLRAAGIELLVDTCSYIAPVLRARAGPVMTDSAKWAYYAPGNIGAGVVLGSTADCVRSAIAGVVQRDASAWGEARVSGGAARFEGRVLVGGEADGTAVVLHEPLSLWGGLDPASGELIDAHHPQRGAALAGRVLVMPASRGSSSSASVLAEAVRAGTAPAAILLAEPDLILAIGAEVARELYGRSVPIVVLAPDEMAEIPDGARVRVADGSVRAS